MLRGQKVFFRAPKADLDRLYACNRESARVWNECLRLAKEHSLQHGAGSPNSCKNKRKGSFISIANRFNPSSTNTSSQDNLRTTPSNKYILLVTLQEKEAFPN
jgi:hypothetical protein